MHTYCRDAYHYYDRLFPKNPFLKINKWENAKFLMEQWEDEKIKEKQKECKNWWIQYKNSLQESIKEKIYS